MRRPNVAARRRFKRERPLPACYPGAMTWLQQREPGCGVVLLRDYPRPVVRLECARCSRAGRYRLTSLIARSGPAAGLPEVLETLAADCPRRTGPRRWSEPCGARYPDLAG